ncbi:unnamed protein product [Prorocentrum cordatum]|uniref:Secreted protein n=1 Tax=Prorocentrum cordatum TaxID=2364126 RepID=A0ABN9WJI0_9DINO|nr:unnamed protein product [Polarella glacialis]
MCLLRSALAARNSTSSASQTTTWVARIGTTRTSTTPPLFRLVVAQLVCSLWTTPRATCQRCTATWSRKYCSSPAGHNLVTLQDLAIDSQSTVLETAATDAAATGLDTNVFLVNG